MELFHQLIYEQFAWYVPSLITRKLTEYGKMNFVTYLYLAGFFLIGSNLRDLIGSELKL